MESAQSARPLEMEPGELARSIVDVLDDRKASDIVLLDIRRQSIIADYFIICTGTSDRQVRALTDNVVEALHMVGVKPLHVEGRQDARWVVLDYGAVLVHIFAPDVRDYYQLEDLWHEATTVARIQ